MPVNIDKKVAFVHIPKAAGSSVEIALDMFGFRNTGDNSILCPDKMFGRTTQHMTIQEMNIKAEQMGIFLGEFKLFTIVRNPYARAVSEYFWRRKWDSVAQESTFEEFVLKHTKDTKSHLFDFDNRHFVPQKEFIDSKVNVFRIEDQLVELEEYLSVFNVRFGAHNQTNDDKVEIVKNNPYAFQILKDVYHLDFLEFDYDPDNFLGERV